MIIPKTFQLLNTTFKVEQVSKVTVDGRSVLGSCDSDKGIIKLRKNLKQELKVQTFLHELTHAILDTLGYPKLSEDEILVDTYSKCLHQILKTME